MKKFICVMLTVLLTLSLFAGCGAKKDDGVLRIAIIQQLDHSSLDEIRLAAQAEIDRIAAEKGITVEYKHFNGQNDTSVLAQIGTQVVADGYDLILPIATLAAQYAVTAAEGKNIPIVYAAVSDPVGAGLTGMSNVTGVSDALNTNFIMDMMFAANPDIQTVGLLYSLSEPNSEQPIKEAKAYLDAKGIPYIEKTGNTADEVITAATALVGRCEAVFTPTDNAIMNVAPSVAEILTNAGIAHYTGADSFVQAGSFVTCGVNYTELGTYAAAMAMDILLGGTIPEFHVMEGGIITVNTDTAKALNLDCSVFNSMANTVIPVTTAK
ncbi:MAG: ABC transporter substrate-binding protein [Oscillospiraceae bacterium]|nr:ABC transporter substrate-binding protein [Oscillospiraceae bacterium]